LFELARNVRKIRCYPVGTTWRRGTGLLEALPELLEHPLFGRGRVLIAGAEEQAEQSDARCHQSERNHHSPFRDHARLLRPKKKSCRAVLGYALPGLRDDEL